MEPVTGLTLAWIMHQLHVAVSFYVVEFQSFEFVFNFPDVDVVVTHGFRRAVPIFVDLADHY